MTAFNSTFKMFAGERKDLSFTVDDITDLTGYSASFSLMENTGSTTSLITKDATINGNTVTVSLMQSDTSTLSGVFYYECKIVDSSQEFQVVAVGNISIQ